MYLYFFTPLLVLSAVSGQSTVIENTEASTTTSNTVRSTTTIATSCSEDDSCMSYFTSSQFSLANQAALVPSVTITSTHSGVLQPSDMPLPPSAYLGSSSTSIPISTSTSDAGYLESLAGYTNLQFKTSKMDPRYHFSGRRKSRTTLLTASSQLMSSNMELELPTFTSSHDGTPIPIIEPTPLPQITLTPVPFPIGGRGMLLNQSLGLSDSGLVVFREITNLDSPQMFVTDSEGHLLPANDTDSILYIHYDPSEIERRKEARPINIRHKPISELDPFDVTIFSIGEEIVQLVGNATQPEFNFYLGDYVGGATGHGNGAYELLASPSNMSIDLAVYKVIPVTILPFIVLEVPQLGISAMTTISNIPTKVTNIADTASKPASVPIVVDIPGQTGVVVTPSIDAYDIISAGDMGSFCSEFLSYSPQTSQMLSFTTLTIQSTLVMTETNEVAGIETLTVSTSKTEISTYSASSLPMLSQSQVSLAPEPRIEFPILSLSPINVDKKAVDIPEALENLDTAQISSGCNRYVVLPSALISVSISASTNTTTEIEKAAEFVTISSITIHYTTKTVFVEISLSAVTPVATP